MRNLDIHSDCREIRALTAMSAPLIGRAIQLRSGRARAYMTAIALMQVTSTSTFTYANEGSPLDYMPSVVYAKVNTRFTDGVGKTLLRLPHNESSGDSVEEPAQDTSSSSNSEEE